MAGLPTETFGGHHHVLAYVYDPVTETNVPMTQPGAAVAGAGAAIYDGVSAAIAATVKNYTNSHPLAVVTVDTNGDPVSAGSDASAANQTAGNASLVSIKTAVETIDNFISGSRGLVTEDNSAAILSALAVLAGYLDGVEGLLALEATAAKQDTGNASLSSVDTKLTSQATAANQTTELASLSSIDGKLTNPLPVSLPAATVVTLTPPAAITGFALDSSLTTLNAKDFATAALQTSGNASLTAIYGVQPSTLVIDGQTVAYSADSTSRRLQEAQAIQGIITTINTIIGSECENSQRMGYELR